MGAIDSFMLEQYKKYGLRCMINGKYLYKYTDEEIAHTINMLSENENNPHIIHSAYNYTGLIIFKDIRNRRLKMKIKKIKKNVPSR